MIWVAYLLLGFALDFIWAEYIKAAASKKALRASLWSVGIYLAGGISVIGYTQQHWVLVPLALGSFAGTFVSVKRDQKKDAEAATASGPA